MLDWRSVMHVRPFSVAPDDVVSIVQEIRETIALELIMIRHQGALFANGARPSGLLKLPGNVADEKTIKAISDAWKAGFNGETGSGSTAILRGGVEFSPISFNSVNSQFLELRHFAVEEIGRGFRIPAVLIGDLQRATWRNAEELGRQFVTHTLRPWLSAFEAAFRRSLLTPDERKNLIIEHLVDDLVRADLAARFDAFSKACGGPWLTPNEIRSVDNRAPIDGADTLRTAQGAAPAADTPPADTQAPMDQAA